MYTKICGIYSLKFRDSSQYIGKSTDILTRYSSHCSLLKSIKHTDKLQTAYNTYGLPKLQILQTCHKDWLDYLEAAHCSAVRTTLLNTVKLPLVGTRMIRKGLKNGQIDVTLSFLHYLNRQ